MFLHTDFFQRKINLSSIFWYWCEWTWPSFKVPVVWESKNFCTHLCTNSALVWMTFGVLWWLGCLLRPVLYILHDQYSREKTWLWWFWNLCLYHWHAFGCMSTNFIQSWFDDRGHWTWQLDMGLNDLDLHSRSQGSKLLWNHSVTKWHEQDKTAKFWSEMYWNWNFCTIVQ